MRKTYSGAVDAVVEASDSLDCMVEGFADRVFLGDIDLDGLGEELAVCGRKSAFFHDGSCRIDGHVTDHDSRGAFPGKKDRARPTNATSCKHFSLCLSNFCRFSWDQTEKDLVCSTRLTSANHNSISGDIHLCKAGKCTRGLYRW